MITITEILQCEQYLADVDGVVFDLDDTLYGEKSYVRSGYRAVATCFPQIERMEEKLWNAFELRQPAIDVVMEAEGLCTQENKTLAIETYRFHTPQLSLYPGVESLLARLKGQKRLGLITDGRPEGQRAKLKALQIEKYFDCIIVTDELGGPTYRKPNKTAFEMMQEALNVPFEKMVYIGDNTKKDFIAPQALGMQAIYFKNQDGLYTG